ncbi:MAG: HepT-like ribonuclease domain-containing protein, partial [Longimicrobiales bacterium]|nr:HepT-like ribonuclease domain-containing protein [Longimicrobiales bacterium]
AVVRQLEILGEAAGRVSRELTSASPEIPWSDITGMRHRLIHDYFEVDVDLVWKTATEHVAEVRPKLVALLKKMDVAR